MTALRVPVEGGDIAVVDQGEGEAVLCLAGGVIADTFAPLFRESAFNEGRRLVRFHRRGYGRTTAPVTASIEQDAADCCAVLDALGIERAHVVGWSYGGVVALQMALDAPASVASLALLEPGVLVVPAAEGMFEALAPAVQAWRDGDPAAALDAFYAVLGRPGWRQQDEAVLPGVAAQAEWDGAGSADHDLPALGAWLPGAERIREVTAPLLQVTADASGPVFAEIRELMTEWLPQTETVVVAGDHSFPFTRAAELVGPLTEFLDRQGAAARQPV